MKGLLIAAVVFSPICALCILGPVALSAFFAGMVGWLGNFGPLATIALIIAAGALVLYQFLRRRERTLPDGEVHTLSK